MKIDKEEPKEKEKPAEVKEKFVLKKFKDDRKL